MARTIVEIPDSQLRDLDALCAALGISRAEAVRRAVQSFLLKRSENDSLGFGLWSRGAADGRSVRDGEDQP